MTLTVENSHKAIIQIKDEPGWYENHGGIGIVVDGQGTIYGLSGNEQAVLRIKDVFGNAIEAFSAPAEGWSGQVLRDTLASCGEMVEEHGVADAYLGDEFLGGTEI